MGNAVFRLESADSDVALDLFLAPQEDPHRIQYRFKHAATDVVGDHYPAPLSICSRYVFLRVLTGIQIAFSLFTLYLWNYLATIRYFFAPPRLFPGMENVSFPVVDIPGDTPLSSIPWVVHHDREEALGAVYLAFTILGLFSCMLLAAYVGLLNSQWWLAWEERTLERDNQQRIQRRLEEQGYFGKWGSSSSRGLRAKRRGEQGVPSDRETSGERLRRLGVRWVSFTRPFYVFSARYLHDFDYRHDMHVRYGSLYTRRDPQTPIFALLTPLVFVLLVIDFFTINKAHVGGAKVTLLQGFVPACSIIFVLYTLRRVILLLAMCGNTCYKQTTNALS